MDIYTVTKTEKGFLEFLTEEVLKLGGTASDVELINQEDAISLASKLVTRGIQVRTNELTFLVKPVINFTTSRKKVVRAEHLQPKKITLIEIFTGETLKEIESRDYVPAEESYVNGLWVDFPEAFTDDRHLNFYGNGRHGVGFYCMKKCGRVNSEVKGYGKCVYAVRKKE